MAVTVEHFEWHGDEIEDRIRAAAVAGLDLASQHLLAESRALVPIEEGTLERSGTATVDAGKLSALVSYDTPYAVRQHEELDYRHAPGRQAKYLEEPFTTQQDVLTGLVAAPIRRAMHS